MADPERMMTTEQINAELTARAHREMDRRLLRGLRVYLLVMPVVFVLAVLGWDTPVGEIPVWMWVLLGVLFLFFPVLSGLLLLARRRGVRRLQPSQYVGLEKAHRKSLLAAVRSVGPVPEEDRPHATALARGLVAQRRLAYLLVPAAFCGAAGRLLSGERGVGDLFAAVSLVLVLVLAPQLLRDARRGRRWLDEHGHEQA
ncbi:hypothetical protein GCM10022223_66610 [Kineosporia mesophila]|uniref:Integral membrane protein n=1 Tax=Kineosporia mesophila TaxID=566012 RepID=A0ABP7ARL2_9ACTN